MDANNTQWLVKPNNESFKAYRWTGNRADLIHTPDWLRSVVYNWEFDEYTSFKHSVTLFYDCENRARSITLSPGDCVLLGGDRLIVLNSDAFKVIFMAEHPTISKENKT